MYVGDDLLTVGGSGFGLVAAVEELAVEQLHAHHGKDQQEQHVHDQNVEHISAKPGQSVESGKDRTRIYLFFFNSRLRINCR